MRRSKFSFNTRLNICMILVNLFLIYYFVFLVLGISTMKENKEKEVVGEENRPETQAQIRPSAGEKRKPLSKNIDISNLPSRRGKKAKHISSQAVKSNSPPPQSSIKVYDVDSSTPTENHAVQDSFVQDPSVQDDCTCDVSAFCTRPNKYY